MDKQTTKNGTMVSFIILNYNSSELTLRCLRSIRRYVAGMEKEIIVVDNASCDDDRARISEQLQAGERLVVSQLNTGFGTGNMLGANAASGDYLCFLNSDIVLREDCITPLCHYLQQHPEIGCITPQQLNIEGKPVPSFKHNPGIRHELLGDGLFERLLPRRYPAQKDFSRRQPFTVAQLNGCLMLFPAEAFWRIGGFDTNIFLYYEEYDVACRLRQIGLQSVVYPTLCFEHLHGATTSRIKKMVVRERQLSKIYAYSKHHGWLPSLLFRLLSIAILLPKPHKWYILPVLFRGEVMATSLRHRVQRRG